jgi:hypothetical protein
MKSISKTIFILIFLTTTVAQAQDYSKVRQNSNVWVNECKTCHTVYQDLAKQTGIRTEQYLFNFVYEHTNKEGKKFGEILSKSEIDFVSRFVLVAVYLHKLETDMRKAGDHLQENIRL